MPFETTSTGTVYRAPATSSVTSVSTTQSTSTTTKPAAAEPAPQQQGGSGSNLGGFISNLFQSIFSTVLSVATASLGGGIVSGLTGLLGLNKGDKKA
jgi:predicted lipid-binding transport protein (Tim44 family)